MSVVVVAAGDLLQHGPQSFDLSAELVTLVANSDGGFFPRLSVAVHVE